MTTDRASAFDEIVANFDMKIPCCWTTKSGKPCRRGANWLLDEAHGCFGGPLCGHHYWEWHRTYVGRTLCGVCNKRFPSFDDAVMVRKL